VRFPDSVVRIGCVQLIQTVVAYINAKPELILILVFLMAPPSAVMQVHGLFVRDDHFVEVVNICAVDDAVGGE
jgi:hypothetical protein